MKHYSTQNSIYVIFRVFDLYTNYVNMKLYVDPIKLKREGQLVFQDNGWTVKPVARHCLR